MSDFHLYPKEEYKQWYRLGALVPVFIHACLVLFMYGVYMSTYIVPLMTNEYQLSPLPPQNALLLQIQHNFFELVHHETSSLTAQQQRGILLFFVTHVLLVLYAVSVYRTSMTSPGHVSHEWDQVQRVNQEQLYQQQQEFLRRFIEEARMRHSRGARVNVRQEGNTSPRRAQGGKVLNNDDSDNSVDGQDGARRSDDQSDSSIVDYPEDEDARLAGAQDAHNQLDEADLLNQINNSKMMQEFKNAQQRFCQKCGMYKPQRTHHCSQCKTCVLKMDHHCQWVNNCIGYKNYKYFVVMLLYTSLLLFVVSMTYSQCFLDALNTETLSGIKFYIISINTVLSFLMFLMIQCFTLFHFFLVSVNKTTIEFCEGKQDGILQRYNIGFLSNFKQVFGSNLVACFVPCTQVPDGEGTDFPQRVVDDYD